MTTECNANEIMKQRWFYFTANLAIILHTRVPFGIVIKVFGCMIEQ